MPANSATSSVASRHFLPVLEKAYQVRWSSFKILSFFKILENKRKRQAHRAFPEMGNSGRFATLQGASHRWCLSEAEADEGAPFALF